MLLIVNGSFKQVVLIVRLVSGGPVLRLLLEELVASVVNIPY